MSFNREVSRIVAALHNPGQSPEQLLEVVSFRCADGREAPRSAGGQYVPSPGSSVRERARDGPG